MVSITELYPYWAILFFVTGSMIGSFFNVLVYRLPNGKSVITPRSSCPHCGHVIQWYENIPVISYCFLRAKCSSCKTHISIQYPLVEFVTAMFSLFLYHFYFRAYISPEMSSLQIITLFVHYLTFILAIPITLIDIRHFIIPDSLSLGGLAIAVVIIFFPDGITPKLGVLGILAGGGTLFLAGTIGSKILKQDAMGGGDVKMLAWFGALFGPFVALGTIFLGSLVGSIISLMLLPINKKGIKAEIPFAPSLYIGLILSVLFGEQLWLWYGNTFLIIK